MRPIIHSLLAVSTVFAGFSVAAAAYKYFPAITEARKVRESAGKAYLDYADEQSELMGAMTDRLKQQGQLTSETHNEAMRVSREKAAKSEIGLAAVRIKEFAERAAADRNQAAIEFLLSCVWLAVSLCGLAVIAIK